MLERLMFWRKKPLPPPRLAPPKCPKCKRELGAAYSTYANGLRLCIVCARHRNA